MASTDLNSKEMEDAIKNNIVICRMCQQKMTYASLQQHQCPQMRPDYQDKVPASPLNVQVGGGHYKQKRIQPVEYIAANNLNFLEGCIVKRITRWRDKNGIEDLQKIKHEVDLLIEMEKRYGTESNPPQTQSQQPRNS